MNKILAVIRREFVSRVRTKAFILSTLLLPVLLIGLLVAEVMVMMSGTDRTTHIAIVDASTQQIGQQISDALGAEKLDADKGNTPRYAFEIFAAVDDPEAMRDKLAARIDSKGEDKLNGVLVLHKDILDTGKAGYYADNVGSMNAMQALRSSLSHELATIRLSSSGIDPDMVSKAMQPVHLGAVKVSQGKITGQSGAASMIIAYAMGYILFMAILIYGQQTMTSVIEEKTSRIMEVLASSLTPFQMLLGKVLGVGLVGLLQMGIWAGSAMLLTLFAAPVLMLFGVSPETAGNLPVPSFPDGLLLVFLLYFVLGFLLYGALYAAIGSMCNTIQETQQYATAVTMVIFVAFLAIMKMTNDPTGPLSTTLSFVPFLSPFTMPVRWSLTAVPWLQLLLSLALTVATLLACVWLAARIYRTGILMYGKKPGVKELWRWLRAG